MGRRKLPIRRIDETSRLQITYSKRKHGLIKKIYEMSVLTGVDAAFISFSQARRLSFFSGSKRIEDVFERYTNSPSFQQNHNLEEQEKILGILDSIRKQTDERISTNAEIRALQQELQMKKEELMRINAEIKRFEVDNLKSKTLEEIEEQEKFLMNVLQRFSQRKMFLTETGSGLNGPLINQNQQPQNEEWSLKPHDNTLTHQNEEQRTAGPAEMNWMHQKQQIVISEGMVWMNQTQQTDFPRGVDWMNQIQQTGAPAEMNWMHQTQETDGAEGMNWVHQNCDTENSGRGNKSCP